MKGNRSLSFLFSANAVSGFAQGISMLAIPWYFNSHGNSQYFNVSYGIITLLVIFWGLYAGTIVDRYNRKSVFLWLNLACGILFGLIAGAGLMGWVTSEVIHELLIVSIFGLTMFNYNIHYPALYAMGQEMVEAKDYGSFNSKIEIVGQSVSILSGGIAAVMLDGMHAGHSFDIGNVHYILPFEIKPWSIDAIIMINAIAHFVAVAFIIPIEYHFQASKVKLESLKIRLNKGFEYLKTHQQVWIFGLASYIVFAMLLVEIHAVLPGYIERHLKRGGSIFALADAVYALGALGSGLMIRKLFRATRVTRAVIFLTLLTALFFIWNSISALVLVTLIMSLVLGFANAGIRILRLTWLFEQVPNEVMGRVNSIFNMANLVFRFLFIFLFSLPLFHESNYIRWAYSVMAVVMIFAAWTIAKKVKD